MHSKQPDSPAPPTEFSAEWAGTLPAGAVPTASPARDQATTGKTGGSVLAVIAAVPLIMVLGNSMLIPAFPQIREAMGLSQFQVGLLITFFSIPAGLTIPLLGFLADRLNRKTIIVPALALYGVGGIISGLAPLVFNNSFGVMLGGRVVQGIAAAGTAPVAMTLAGDLFQGGGRSRALGILEATNGLGKVISPILGALLVLIVWWSLFFVYAALAFPVAALVAWLVKEPQKNQKTAQEGFRAYFKGVAGLFKDQAATLLISFAAGMLALFTLFGVLSYLSDLLEVTYGLTGLLKGLVLAVPVMASAATALANGFVLQKKPHWLKPALLTGLGLFTAALLLTIMVKGIPAMLGTLAVLGLGTGLILPGLNTIVTSSAPHAKRGAITAFYNAVRFIGVALGPPVFSLLEKGGPWLLFGPWAAIGGVTLLLAWWLLNPPQLSGTTG
ncbi:MAG: MFS transporter [Heliobacteriaceae bacterium]|nr:MFS transporter [Heliobacteriaceae bacterium]